MELDELLDLTVNKQEDELENLSKKELKELREKESRQTAIDNIDGELSSRQEDSRTEKDEHPQTVPTDTTDIGEGNDGPSKSELERKVDYLIEKCKTTSIEGFENYED